MKNLILTLIIVWGLTAQSLFAGEIYIWTDKYGNTFYSDSPPPTGSFKKQNIEDKIDKAIDKKKDIDKKTDISESDKLEEKLKIEMDYQKKAKSIRDYDAMREELEALREKYQKKDDLLKERWKSSFGWPSTRHDIIEERNKLGREYENEIKKIKKLYGYY